MSAREEDPVVPPVVPPVEFVMDDMELRRSGGSAGGAARSFYSATHPHNKVSTPIPFWSWSERKRAPIADGSGAVEPRTRRGAVLIGWWPRTSSSDSLHQVSILFSSPIPSTEVAYQYSTGQVGVFRWLSGTFGGLGLCFFCC
jgi:hypothetical protein